LRDGAEADRVDLPHCDGGPFGGKDLTNAVRSNLDLVRLDPAIEIRSRLDEHWRTDDAPQGIEEDGSAVKRRIVREALSPATEGGVFARLRLVVVVVFVRGGVAELARVHALLEAALDPGGSLFVGRVVRELLEDDEPAGHEDRASHAKRVVDRRDVMERTAEQDDVEVAIPGPGRPGGDIGLNHLESALAGAGGGRGVWLERVHRETRVRERSPGSSLAGPNIEQPHGPGAFAK
jgi:hypothetical protein